MMNNEANMQNETTTAPMSLKAIMDMLAEATASGRNLYYAASASAQPLRVILAKHPWAKAKGGLPPVKDKSVIQICTTSNATPWLAYAAGGQFYIN